jgi:hypothetical protein
LTEERPPLGPRGAVAILLALTLAAYWGVFANDFVAYDDGPYVTENPAVQEGLTAEGIGWAFTSLEYQYNWHPLTWLSHMLDVQLFGLSPAGHHATSLLLHAAGALLCFFALRRMTGAVVPAFFVAALFAVHPLRVESVAWVAERKDVLSGALFFATLLAYARYVEERSPGRYLLVIASFVLGLLAKPMLVTLPLLLLVLDLWPLRRAEPLAKLIGEKLPLFVLVLISSLLTLRAQHAGGALGALDTLSLGDRVENASIAYGVYLWKTVWPTGLAMFHPHPALVSPQASRLLPLLVSAVVLAACTLVALRERRRRPYYLAGWLWFLGTLVPVIGLVQVGDQAWSERYAYVTLVGVYIGGAFCLAALPDRGRRVAVGLGALALLFCVWQTNRQVRVWRDSESLFRHALAVTERNYIAESNLGRILGDDGDLEAAREHFERAVEFAPGFYEGWLNLGKAHYKQRAFELAVPAFERALELAPDEPEARFNLGAAYASVGRYPEAVAELEEALRLRPDYPAVSRTLEQLQPLSPGDGD